MCKHSNVEQVGFIDKKNRRLIMAGGEFCGNATRAAVWWMLSGKQGEILIEVSGNQNQLRAGVDASGDVWLEILLENTAIRKAAEGYIVDLPGISHLVVENAISTNPDELKLIAKKLIAKYYLNSKPAAGVMFVSKSGNAISLQPVVYVTSIDTFIYETACGSGSIAVCLLSHISKQIVTQPSGMGIKVEKLAKGLVKISGKVDFIEKGKILI